MSKSVVALSLALCGWAFTAAGKTAVNLRLDSTQTDYYQLHGGIDVSMIRYLSLGIEFGYYDATSIKDFDNDLRISTIGLRFSGYFSGMNSDSVVAYVSALEKTYKETGYRTATSRERVAKIGYRWLWSNGFNIMPALGVRSFKYKSGWRSRSVNNRGAMEIAIGYQV